MHHSVEIKGMYSYPFLTKIRENNGFTMEVTKQLFPRNFLEESKFLDFPHCVHVEGKVKTFVKPEHQNKR